MLDHSESSCPSRSALPAASRAPSPWRPRTAWRKHGSENTDHEIKRLIRQLLQIGRIAFLKRAVGEAMLRGALVSSLHQVARDIDAQHVRSEFRRGQRRGAIAAPEVEHL